VSYGAIYANPAWSPPLLSGLLSEIAARPKLTRLDAQATSRALHVSVVCDRQRHFATVNCRIAKGSPDYLVGVIFMIVVTSSPLWTA
jgi:hypothetical protein